MDLLEMSNVSSVSEQKFESYNPWSMPDDFTVYKMAPDNVKPLLHAHWKTQKAIHPIFAYFCGLYLLLMGIIAFRGNLIVLKTLKHFKSLRTPANTLIMNLAISDLCLIISLVPAACYNFFNGGPWRFGYWGCQIHAFCGAFFGCNQINTLTFIAWDRYNVIVKGLACNKLTYSKVSTWITFTWIWSFAWAIIPIFGFWGSPYVVDGMLGTCSFDNFTSDWYHKSFIMASFWCQYGFHILIIFCLYYSIVKAVLKHKEELQRQAEKMNVNISSLINKPDYELVFAEYQTAKVIIVNITLWAITWTPFKLNAIIGTWHSPAFIDPLTSELPILMSMTSAMCNPIVYALIHPKYRKCMKERFPWLCIAIDN